MIHTDVLIAGSGCAALYCALSFPSAVKITLITKKDLRGNNSYLAQGGMAVKKDDQDFTSYFEDTLNAGHRENDPESVRIMIDSSKDLADSLLSLGVRFNRDKNGTLLYTREGAHSKKRILFHQDNTGQEITEKLLQAVQSRPNIQLLEYTPLIDLLVQDNLCYGAVIADPDQNCDVIFAKVTILATGGLGGLFPHSTNLPHLTGDAFSLALKHQIALRDMDYIQIHPTTLYSDHNNERAFLISESVRGEGAKLYGKDGERFVNELLPRDVVTKAIYHQMKIDSMPFVWEDLRPIPREELELHFPNIVAYCKEHGYDVTKECIPVVPAQHYFMGGIRVDHQGKTSMKCLYAVGETACNGVHGKNRLASNSLLESMVFSKRAAADITKQLSDIPTSNEIQLPKTFSKSPQQFIQENQERIYHYYQQLEVL